MNGKGRPEKLTDELKLWITRWHRHRKKKLKAPALQDEIRLKLEDDIRKENPTWTGTAIGAAVTERLPGISSLQKYLKEVDFRAKEQDEKGLDGPWHLGLLPRYYYLSAEAVSEILEAQIAVSGFYVSNPQIEGHPNWGTPVKRTMSVRTALWVARLYEAVGTQWAPDDHLMVFCVAQVYADLELLSEISGTPFDTSGFDITFRKDAPGFFGAAKELALYGWPADDKDPPFSHANLSKAGIPITQEEWLAYLLNPTVQLKKDGEK